MLSDDPHRAKVARIARQLREHTGGRPVSMQRLPTAYADGNSRAKNSLTSSGVGISIATMPTYSANARARALVRGRARPGRAQVTLR